MQHLEVSGAVRHIYIYVVRQLRVNFVSKYRVTDKSLRDFRPLWYSSRDGHAEGRHVNRGRDIPNFLSYLTGSRYIHPWCLSWLLRSRVWKFRRDLRITLYIYSSLLHKRNREVLNSVYLKHIL